MKKKGVSTLKIAATYIGTVVGAGFATGQEILQFFARFGVPGLLGIFLAAALFVFFGYMVMALGRQLHARSHLEVIRYTSGRISGRITDILITFFLFGSFATMVAGTGALFQQQLGLPNMMGNLLMGILTAITVLTGVEGVINSISFVVPFLLISVICISTHSILNTPPNFSAAVYMVQNRLIANWFLSAILYVSYNTMLSISVLAALGTNARNQKALKNGAILGGAGLGLASALIFLALCGNMSGISNLEIPMVYIAGGISPLAQILYAMVLIAEIYTTAVGSLFGFVSRIAAVKQRPLQGRIVVIGSTIVALLASQFGFSNMVKYFFPLEGLCGMFLLFSLTRASLKQRRLHL